MTKDALEEVFEFEGTLIKGLKDLQTIKQMIASTEQRLQLILVKLSELATQCDVGLGLLLANKCEEDQGDDDSNNSWAMNTMLDG